MAGSSFGTIFCVTTWGESHGTGIGVVVDGCPANLPLSEADIQPFLDRRRPGRSRFATKRQETDTVRILSGVFEGKTTGTPISLMVENLDMRSADYSEIASYYRPGHADETFDAKYGFRDYRGGGRSSGRETIGRVAAGAIALKILNQLGFAVLTYTSSIGPVTCDPARFDKTHLFNSQLGMPDPEAEKKAAAYLEDCMARQTSAGGQVDCRVSSMKAGLGEPVFKKLDALLGQALFSIGAVKAVEIGAGTNAAKAQGHENNDQYTTLPDGRICKKTNHAGGILGGISDGSDLTIRVTFKPTPSIALPQTALFRDGYTGQVSIRGRHDPIIVSRAGVVVESMVALTLVDLLLQNMCSRMEDVSSFYERRDQKSPLR